MAVLPERPGGLLAKNVDGIIRTGARRPGATAPGGGVIGDLWYDTSTSTLKVWNGTAWASVISSTATGSVCLNDQTLFLRGCADNCHRIRYVSGTQGDLGSMDGAAILGNGRSALFSAGCSGGTWNFIWDSNKNNYMSDKLVISPTSLAALDSETLTLRGAGSGISIRDRDNDGLRSVVYSSAGRGRLWRSNDVLTWTSAEIQLDVRTLGPNDRPLVECLAGSSLTGAGTETGIIMMAGTTVINYNAGNSNFNFPGTFPHGVLSVVIINGDSGGSAGGPNVVYSTSNTSTSASGTSAVTGSTGAGINGNARLNFIVVGW